MSPPSVSRHPERAGLPKKTLRSPLTIPAEAGLRAMVGAMLEAGISRHLYVVDGQGHLCGSLSVLTVLEQLTLLQTKNSRPIKDRALGTDRPRVRDIMDLHPRYLTRDNSLSEAVQMMLRERLTELPVVDRRMRLLGELRAQDILRARIDEITRKIPNPQVLVGSDPPSASDISNPSTQGEQVDEK